jgi:hypothetical protein
MAYLVVVVLSIKLLEMVQSTRNIDGVLRDHTGARLTLIEEWSTTKIMRLKYAADRTEKRTSFKNGHMRYVMKDQFESSVKTPRPSLKSDRYHTMIPSPLTENLCQQVGLTPIRFH